MDVDEKEEEGRQSLPLHKQNVDAAVQRLQDLAYTTVIKSGLDLSHIEDFQSLSQELSQLAEDCYELHDLLEIETIAASKRRHALQLLPQRYRKEMEDSVMSARLANEDEMKSLQNQLEVAQEKVAQLNQKHQELTEENQRLQPESNQIRKEHDDIIAQLNQRMSDKANKQITLNETHDALRDVQQHLSDLVVGHEILAEELEEERKEAATEKQQLKEEVEKTETSITDQKSKNAIEKRETDKILEKIMEMGAKVDEKQKVIRRLDSSRARLEMQCFQMTDKIERERRANKELFEGNEILSSEKDRQRREYEQKVLELEKKLQKVLNQIAEAEKENIALVDGKDTSKQKRDQAVRRRSKFQSKSKEMSIHVENLKNQTTRLLTTHAAVQDSNETMRSQLATLEENHEATITTYNTQIEEYKISLGQERDERVKVQEQREESEKKLEHFRAEEVHFMNSMAQSIADANEQQKAMHDKSVWLRQETAKATKQIQTMEVRLEINQSSFRTMKESLGMELERLESSIELLSGDNVKKSNLIEEKKPAMKKLQTDIDEQTKSYNHFKQEVISVRNKEKSADDKLKRIKLQLDKLEQPMDELKTSIKEKQQDAVTQLEQHAEERTQIEADIYKATMKLEHVNKENQRFEEDNQSINDDMEVLASDMLAHAAHQRVLHEELSNIRRRFSEAWKECVEMEENSSDQDKTILGSIGQLQQETKERSGVLLTIGSSLRVQLDKLTAFAENIANRRPKDTRQSKRRLSSMASRSRLSNKDSRRNTAAASSSGMLESTPAVKGPLPDYREDSRTALPPIN